jgi:hypothetical protein
MNAIKNKIYIFFYKNTNFSHFLYDMMPSDKYGQFFMKLGLGRS